MLESEKILIKKIADSVSEEEQRLLDIAMLDSNFRKEAQQYEKIWEISKDYSPHFDFDANSAFEKFTTRISQEKELSLPSKMENKRRFLFSPLSIAASFIALVLVSFIIYHTLTPITSFSYVSQDKAMDVVLPDNSVIALNKNSSIEYSYEKADHRRIINFQGEGFFNIAKDMENPLFINLDGLQLSVVGTSFNVNAPKDGNTTVIVKEGIVKVKDNSDNELTLHKNERAVLDKESKILSKSMVDLDQFVLWNEGELSFISTPLASVAQQVEVYYGIEIEVPSDIRDCLFTSPNLKNVTSDQMITILERSFQTKIINTAKGKYAFVPFVCM